MKSSLPADILKENPEKKYRYPSQPTQKLPFADEKGNDLHEDHYVERTYHKDPNPESATMKNPNRYKEPCTDTSAYRFLKNRNSDLATLKHSRQFLYDLDDEKDDVLYDSLAAKEYEKVSEEEKALYDSFAVSRDNALTLKSEGKQKRERRYYQEDSSPEIESEEKDQQPNNQNISPPEIVRDSIQKPNSGIMVRFCQILSSCLGSGISK